MQICLCSRRAVLFTFPLLQTATMRQEARPAGAVVGATDWLEWLNVVAVILFFFIFLYLSALCVYRNAFKA